jgi:hypothetical protein
MVELFLKQARDIMINNKKKYKIIDIVRFLWLYYGSNEQEYTYIKTLMDKIDDIVFEKKQSNIELNNDEIKQLLDFINVIQKESETWDEWSIITGKSLKELEEFKNIFRLKKICTTNKIKY